MIRPVIAIRAIPAIIVLLLAMCICVPTAHAQSPGEPTDAAERAFAQQHNSRACCANCWRRSAMQVGTGAFISPQFTHLEWPSNNRPSPAM